MKIKKILLKDIISFLSADLIKIYGIVDDSSYIDNITEVSQVNESSLDWINPSKLNKQEIAENSKAGTLLVDKSIVFSAALKNKILLVVSNPKVSLAEIGNHFFVDKIENLISDKAEINPKAKIGKNVSIGAFSVIGACSIGDNTIIDSNVRIYDDVVIGDDCNISTGCVLGGAGFGFERDKKGNHFLFPQIGSLKIGNYVSIGSNTSIDRGSLSDTVIGDYTKISSLCHIAHNNHIGKNVIITGCSMLSGSNIIEDNVWIAPNVSVKGMITIGKGAIVGMGAVVVKNIPSGETWVGCPAKKLEK